MLLTEFIGKASDAVIVWKETTFFYAEVASNSHLFME
jgi:hypothetical protein